jgi:hypothetical protein
MPKLAQVNFLPIPKLWRDFRSSESRRATMAAASSSCELLRSEPQGNQLIEKARLTF